MKPTIGRIVLYTLTDQDAAEINRRRTTGPLIAERIKKNTPDTSAWPLGAQAHIGNSVNAGDVYPMIVTRVWTDTCVNGQVLLDGNDCLWATSATEGTGGHTWCWPPRSLMTDRERAILKLLSRCMRDGLVTGLGVDPPVWQQAAAEWIPVSPDKALSKLWMPVSLDEALSKLPPARTCYCGCQ